MSIVEASEPMVEVAVVPFDGELVVPKDPTGPAQPWLKMASERTAHRIREYASWEADAQTFAEDEASLMGLFVRWHDMVAENNHLVRSSDPARIIETARRSGLIEVGYDIAAMMSVSDFGGRLSDADKQWLRLYTWLETSALDTNTRAVEQVYDDLCQSEWPDWPNQQALIDRAMEIAAGKGDVNLALKFADNLTAPELCINRLLRLLPGNRQVERYCWLRFDRDLSGQADLATQFRYAAALAAANRSMPLVISLATIPAHELLEGTEPAV